MSSTNSYFTCLLTCCQNVAHAPVVGYNIIIANLNFIILLHLTWRIERRMIMHEVLSMFSFHALAYIKPEDFFTKKPDDIKLVQPSTS